MNVKTIELHNFMTHRATKLDLPPRGIIVVTGDNGSGKSTLVEGVSVALWGKTLRGTSPWPESPNGVASAHCALTGGLWATRTKKTSRTELEWDVEEDESAEGMALDALRRLGPDRWESTSKAQEALEPILGSFDVWRRSRVFSSSDAFLFTMATDSERKRLLESIIGLERFDDALEKCRHDLKLNERIASTADMRLHEAAIRLEGERKRLEDAEQQLASLTAPPDMPLEKPGQTTGDLDAMIATADKDIADRRRTLREYENAGGGHDAEARVAETTLRRLEQAGDKCPTCTQPITEALKGKIRSMVESAKRLAVQARSKNKSELESLEAEFEELTEEKVALTKQRDELVTARRLGEASKAERARYEQTKARLEKAVVEAKTNVVNLEDTHDMAMSDVKDAAKELATMHAVEKVLGLKGVRAMVLGKALGGVEQLANAWLAKLRRRNLLVELKPYSEKKTGGVTDAISLNVKGAGGGNGYRGASGGERRRIDVALILALGEIAGAAHGRGVGTMWFDEVFDALDSDGVDAVSELLEELAEDQPVVVITHNSELADRLMAARRLHITAGKIAA